MIRGMFRFDLKNCVGQMMRCLALLLLLAVGGGVRAELMAKPPVVEREVLQGYSMLYLKPQDKPTDMYGDLYQCALDGKDPVRLLVGVSEYYPQANGVVLATRRTSRSGYDLLYVKAGMEELPAIRLYAASYIGAAALNSKGDTWAAIARPAVGSGWKVAVARIGADTTKAITLPLPDEVQPERIAWEGDKLMILGKNGEALTCLAITPTADAPTWEAVGAHLFPGLTSYMLNKSESLEITQVTKDGKPAVEVASVWFTGDRTIITTLNGLTLQGHDLFNSSVAFIWGELDGKPVTYTVDISTGKAVSCFPGDVRDIKPFAYVRMNAPIIY